MPEDGKRTLKNVEIFRPGVHVPMTGEVLNWTRADLEDIVAAFDEGAVSDVFLKIGHTSEEFCALVAQKLGVPQETVRGEGPGGNGKISLGRAVAVRLRDDGVMEADFEAPDQVVDLIEKGFTDVSVEMEGGHPGHKWVLSAVALLGAERPAVKGLAGLEELAVLSERQPAYVMRFSVTPAGLVPRAGAEESQLDELEAVNKAMDTFLKGKKAGTMLRQAWEKFQLQWATLLGQDFTEEKEGHVDLTKLMAALKMQGEATEEQILTMLSQIMDAQAAIAAALGIGAEAPPEEMAEKVRAMAADIKALSEKATAATFAEGLAGEQLKAAVASIKVLETDKRTAAYMEKTRGFTAIAFKPEEMAAQLVELEDKVGAEAVERQLAGWAQTQKYATDSGLLVRIGTSRGDDSDKPALEVDMEKWATEKGKTMAEAYARFRAERPVEFREWRAAQRNGD